SEDPQALAEIVSVKTVLGEVIFSVCSSQNENAEG
ncbi:MAG: hypothetical protein AMDU4_FER2C00317G0001, partial [Ferroplasma sp. Type II]